MKAFYTETFLKEYSEAPLPVTKCADKQIIPLLNNIRHPSLHAKKYDGTSDLWQARVTLGWRLYFTIENDKYVLLNLQKHP